MHQHPITFILLRHHDIIDNLSTVWSSDQSCYVSPQLSCRGYGVVGERDHALAVVFGYHETAGISLASRHPPQLCRYRTKKCFNVKRDFGQRYNKVKVVWNILMDSQGGRISGS